MATYPRYTLIWDGCTVHVTWQCHNLAWLLQEDWAKQRYYDLLYKYKERYEVVIHSYDFMSNHPHFTASLQGSKENFSAFLRIVNSQFARFINRRLQRRGQVCMDRFKSPVIQDDATHLHVMTYGNLNPVRAGITDHPRHYRWTSYHYYADGRADPLITPAPAYLALGPTSHVRQFVYRQMIDEILAHEAMIKRSYSSCPFLGNPTWVLERHADLRRYRLAKTAACQRRQRRLAQTLAPP
ncbi:MAG: transposase [Deltaproteobacteria bacterium]|nr:transposase [Deltaproteobacteria bacterium]